MSKNLDETISRKLYGKTKKCRHGHLNGPTAKVCWKCGETLR